MIEDGASFTRNRRPRGAAIVVRWGGLGIVLEGGCQSEESTAGIQSGEIYCTVVLFGVSISAHG